MQVLLSGLGCGRDGGGKVLALCSRMRVPIPQKMMAINWGWMLRSPLGVPHPLLKPLRRHRGLNVPGRGAAASLSGSIHCLLLAIRGGFASKFSPFGAGGVWRKVDGGEGGGEAFLSQSIV